MVYVISAWISAFSSITGPRPTLITTAVGFMTAIWAAPIMCFVSGVSGAAETVIRRRAAADAANTEA